MSCKSTHLAKQQIQTPNFSRFSVDFEQKTAHFFRFQPLFAQRKCSPGFA
jgi:hypothetical protein